jgi:hypothetical protein
LDAEPSFRLAGMESEATVTDKQKQKEAGNFVAGPFLPFI